MKSITHLSTIKVDDDYGTPNVLLKKIMVNYDVLPFLDVCATHTNTKFQDYFTAQDDALSRPWDVDFWCNPPYSQVYDFMKYGYSQHLKHNVTRTCLTYSKTDTKWWHEFVEDKAEVHFIQGRVKFLKDGNPTKHPAPYPSCIIIWRKK